MYPVERTPLYPPMQKEEKVKRFITAGRIARRASFLNGTLLTSCSVGQLQTTPLDATYTYCLEINPSLLKSLTLACQSTDSLGMHGSVLGGL